MTTATCTPLRTTSAICRATWCTTSGSRPTSPPPNISPPSLSTTREYIGRIGGGSTPLGLVNSGSAIRLLRGPHMRSPLILPHSGRKAAMGTPRGGLAFGLVCSQQPGRDRLATVGFVAHIAERHRQVLELEVVRQVGVDAGRPDLVDRPVLGHHLAQFVFGDGVRRAVRQSGAVEHEHVIRRPRRGCARDRLLVALAGFDGDRVEESGIDDGVEPAVVSAECADVGDLEAGVGQTPLDGFGRGELDGGRRKVEADGGEATLREVKVDSRLAAPDVEDVAAELALLDERGDLRLRFTDTPWR